MRKMSLEERKKWYENHLEQIVLRVWHGVIDNEVHASKFIGCDEAIPNEWYLKTIIVGAELSISQEYFGAAVTEQTLSKQEWLGCDLSELHAEIEDNDYETAIHCLIKDGKIVKKFYSIGTAETVKRAYDFNDVINEAKKINADGIYHFHNHPVTLAAWPSPGDVNFASKEAAKALENNLQYNYGVVSCEDYWDYAQMNLSGEEIIKKYEERFNKEKNATEGKEMSSAEIARKLKEVTDKQ